MLRKNSLWFMLNQRAGTPVKPKNYEGIRLYWAPTDIHKTRERLKSLGYSVSELDHRDYNQTEFFLTDDDGFSHCFGVPTQKIDISNGTINQALQNDTELDNLDPNSSDKRLNVVRSNQFVDGRQCGTWGTFASELRPVQLAKTI